ncbi:hypothetical protein DFH06DRAFT_373484 [Mycena polygramma]|nr:hypothetical protein DFH06DRAFT_373484 [Mycena polygramma]
MNSSTTFKTSFRTLTPSNMAHPCWNCGAPANASSNFTPALETAPGFMRLRTSNDAPLDSEVPLIREIISNGEELLDALENQIRNSEAALANLVQRRGEAAEQLREHRAILHPLRRTPPELICEIFDLARDCPEDSTNDNGLGCDLPWYLVQICQSWRFLALAYPRLWSNITIPSSPMPSVDSSVFEALLLRSANVPLHVCWTALKEAEVEPAVDRKLADLVLAHCRRWRTLRLDLSKGPAADALNWLSLVKGSLSSLKRLNVLCSGNIFHIPDVFSVAPSLCQVLLTDWQFAYYSPDLHFPWNQITHYRGAYKETSQLDILRTASNLVQCAISFETPEFVSLTPGESPSIVLRHLRGLCIEKPRFLHHLTAPSLEELYCTYAYRREDTLPLLPIVHRSSCLLQKLVLMSCYISSDLISTLRILPSLTYLLIEAPASADEQGDLFGQMMLTGTSRDLCPNLSSLVYGCSDGFPHRLFFAMVQSRLRPSPPGSRLTYLRMFDPWTSSDILSATRELSEEGYDAGVLTGTEFALLAGKGFFS